MNTKAIVYDQMMQEISAIPKNKILTPTMPMDVYIQEAIHLYHWAQGDKSQLFEAGLPEELLEDLPFRADAASEAHAIWHNFLFGQTQTLQRWNTESPEAWEIREEMLHSMRYAYRYDTVIRSKISRIAAAQGDIDLIQDLQSLAAIGRENPAPLRHIGFDMALLEKAFIMSQGMEALKDSTSENNADSMVRRMRDQAYTHLKEAVDAVRECGQFVFWKNTARRLGYETEYPQRDRRSSAPPQPYPAEQPSRPAHRSANNRN